MNGERMFPIQDAPDIPWRLIAPHEERARRNHGGQTLQRLAERGGLGAAEACDVLMDLPWATTPHEDAAKRLVLVARELLGGDDD